MHSMAKFITGAVTPAVPAKAKLHSKPPRKRAQGGGPKAGDGASNTVRKLVLVDPETVAVLTAVGGGQFSLGIREAARRLVELGDTGPFTAERHSKRARNDNP